MAITDLAQLADVTSAFTTISNVLLVTPDESIGYQPLSIKSTGAVPLESMLFHYEGENSITLDSDISNHYIEDNTTITDQIALHPEVVTVHGFIGELNDVVPPALKALKKAADKLTIINAYTPAISTTAILAYNEAAFLYQVGSQAIDAAKAATSVSLDTLNPKSSGFLSTDKPAFQTKQAIFFNKFYLYWQSKTLFKLQTPWQIFYPMAIKSLRAIQEEGTDRITDFEIVFQKINFVKDVFSGQIRNPRQGRAAAQNAAEADNGVNIPPDAPFTLGQVLAVP